MLLEFPRHNTCSTRSDRTVNTSDTTRGVPAWIRVGQMVSYECTKTGFPRWHFGVDRGGNNKFCLGVIDSIVGNVVFVRGSHFHEDEKILWRYPLPGHPEYVENQWDRDGWIQPYMIL